MEEMRRFKVSGEVLIRVSMETEFECLPIDDDHIRACAFDALEGVAKELADYVNVDDIEEMYIEESTKQEKQ